MVKLVSSIEIADRVLAMRKVTIGFFIDLQISAIVKREIDIEGNFLSQRFRVSFCKYEFDFSLQFHLF